MVEKKSIGIILSGGIGRRFKGDKPKQYYQINGKKMIQYSIDAFKNSKKIDDFVVVVEDEYQKNELSKEYSVKTVVGGKTRNHSLKNALDYINFYYPECEKIIENNAACPMITPKIIDDILTLLDNYDYVQCTYKITDALGSYTNRIVNREDYFLIQSPDAYHFKMLYDCFDPEHPIGHPAVQLPANATGYNYFDFIPNIKVTYPEDLVIVEQLLKNKSE